ncbi:hypothetical protein ACFFIO_05805 [Citricoccus parietis]|uniref:Uncharacterized protein n=1 Tax=Citricoccus parietis TaxID=592307 RepID=A0ABV6F3B7_9MICC
MPAPDLRDHQQGPTPAGQSPAGAGPRSGRERRGTRPTGRRGWVPLLVAVLIGAGVGILGTVLHLHFSWIGGTTTEEGAWVLPWGAVLALLLVASAQLWWTLRSSLAWTGGVVAIAAFTTAMVMGNWPGLDTFAVAANDYTFAVVPGPAIAGTVWVWGLPAVAIITMLLAQPLLRYPVARD